MSITELCSKLPTHLSKPTVLEVLAEYQVDLDPGIRIFRKRVARNLFELDVRNLELDLLELNLELRGLELETRTFGLELGLGFRSLRAFSFACCLSKFDFAFSACLFASVCSKPLPSNTPLS